MKTILLRLEDELLPRLVTVVMADDKFANFYDRTEMSHFYRDNPESTVESAIMHAWHKIEISKCITVSAIVEPREEEQKKKFKEFQENYKKTLENRSEIPRVGFISVSDTRSKSLTNQQRENYRFLERQSKASDNERFKLRWVSGEFHLSTFLSRLKHSKVPNIDAIYVAVQSRHSEIKPKDWGLTDTDVLEGFDLALLNFEKKIFKALLRGNKNLVDIAEVYSNITENITPELRKRFSDLTN